MAHRDRQAKAIEDRIAAARQSGDIKAMQRIAKRLLNTILWADGQRGSFEPRSSWDGPYWWRTEMMKRARTGRK